MRQSSLQLGDAWSIVKLCPCSSVFFETYWHCSLIVQMKFLDQSCANTLSFPFNFACFLVSSGENVYFCDSIEEVQSHTLQRRCVAFVSTPMEVDATADGILTPTVMVIHWVLD